MKTIRTALLGLLCLISMTTYAQAYGEPAPKNFSIASEVISFFNAGFNLDFEMRLKGSNNWLNLRLTGHFIPDYSERGYYYDVNEWKTLYSGSDRFSELSGMGIDFTYKRTFWEDKLYCGAGFGYHYFDVLYWREEYEPFIEDGLTFYEYRQGYRSQYFNKINPFLTIGIRTPLHKGFFIEGFLSPGYTYSFYDKNRKSFDSTMFSFGHRGFSLGVGARIGWAF